MAEISNLVTVFSQLHRDRKNAPPPKQNAVTCTVYNTIQ